MNLVNNKIKLYGFVSFFTIFGLLTSSFVLSSYDIGGGSVLQARDEAQECKYQTIQTRTNAEFTSQSYPEPRDFVIVLEKGAKVTAKFYDENNNLGSTKTTRDDGIKYYNTGFILQRGYNKISTERSRDGFYNILASRSGSCKLPCSGRLTEVGEDDERDRVREGFIYFYASPFYNSDVEFKVLLHTEDLRYMIAFLDENGNVISQNEVEVGARTTENDYVDINSSFNIKNDTYERIAGSKNIFGSWDDDGDNNRRIEYRRFISIARQVVFWVQEGGDEGSETTGYAVKGQYLNEEGEIEVNSCGCVE